MSFLTSKATTALAIAATILPASAQLYNKVINIESGPVQGFKYFNESTLESVWGTNNSNVAAFLGIPYAADTSYQNRWKPPKPRQPWNETFKADSYGLPCPSSWVSEMSEDCLSVNIWTGANSSSDKLPVLVWNQGSDETSSNWDFSGGGLAMKGVIVVTFNRRDDAFGYLAHPELNAESLAENGHNSSGNYGVLDHKFLLEWVQKNIAHFGGDPDRVTIAGQSFGSSQVYHAVNSELFSGLFHGAISESGLRYPYDPILAGIATSYVTMEDAIAFGQNYTRKHNVSSIAELRTLSTEDLLQGSQDRNYNIWWVTALTCQYPLIFKPVLDGYVLPEKYIDILKSGPANDVPLITGNNKDESGASTSTNYTVAEYKNDCTLKYGNLSEEYFKLYPANNKTQADMSWNAAARDTSVVSSWAFANEWVKSASNPFYTYYWDHAPPGQSQGAYHESEVGYIMNSLFNGVDLYPYTWYDWYLADVMSSYWANFVKTGNPNNGGSYKYDNLTYWAPNDGHSQTVFHVGQAFGNRSIAEPEQVNFIMDYFAQQTPY
ncbi:hypothetical protein MW887_009893 [Aspergillus wentii]|nr:hypothetical protein MW887_009893 [Aspergillus wentii]